MNYRMEETARGFAIVETITDLTVRIADTRERALRLLKHLNRGGAFDGWTPMFFLKHIEIHPLQD